MKSRLLFAVTISFVTTFAFSQLKVISSGNVGIGTSTPASKLSIGNDGYTGYSISVLGFTGGNYYRAIQASQPLTSNTSYSYYGMTSSVSSGSGGFKLMGVYGNSYRGTTATGARTYGVYGLAGNGISGYNYGIFGSLSGSRNGAAVFGSIGQSEVYIDDKYAGYFYGDVKVTGDLDVDGTCTGSDIKIKKNVAPIEDNVLAKLAQLQTIRYKLKHPSEIGELSDTVDMALISKEMQSEKYLRDRFGLIAQELETTFPEVVKLRSDGYLGVRYTELIPILVNAINQQQLQIEDLNAQINNPAFEKGTQAMAMIDEANIIISGSILEQNSPNPFNEKTCIKYSIPIIVSKALVNIYDLQGSQVKSYEISNAGDGELLVPASELKPGLYIYNLIVDGVEVSSKRMVLTD